MRSSHQSLAPAFFALLALPFLVAASAPPSAVVTIVADPASGLPRYDPPLVFIEPGETVLFANEGQAHAARPILEMKPPAAEPWWGQVGEDVAVTFTEPGVYGHKCGGAYALGLVGLVVVGDPRANLDEARAIQHPPAAAHVLEELFDEIDATLGR